MKKKLTAAEIDAMPLTDADKWRMKATYGVADTRDPSSHAGSELLGAPDRTGARAPLAPPAAVDLQSSKGMAQWPAPPQMATPGASALDYEMAERMGPAGEGKIAKMRDADVRAASLSSATGGSVNTPMPNPMTGIPTMPGGPPSNQSTIGAALGPASPKPAPIIYGQGMTNTPVAMPTATPLGMPGATFRGLDAAREAGVITSLQDVATPQSQSAPARLPYSTAIMGEVSKKKKK